MSIRIEPTEDLALIKTAMTHPETFKFISDDGSVPREEFQPVLTPYHMYLAAWDDDCYLGLFLFVKNNCIMWEAHNCMMPVARGKRCREAGKKAIQWMWDNTDAERIFGYIPADNPIAHRFSLDVGAEVFGINKKAFKRDGKLVDLMYYGLSKE